MFPLRIPHWVWVDMPHAAARLHKSMNAPTADPMNNNRRPEQTDLSRRAFLRSAGIGIATGLVAASALSLTADAQEQRPIDPEKSDRGPLGPRLQGVQHFGVTVQNMERAFAFYTGVLGGTEIMRDGNFQGERIHNTLLTDQEIEARVRNVDPQTRGIPDLKGGAQRLDVRFVQFDNVVIELLHYRNAGQPAGGGGTFAEPLDPMSPAFPRMMHICFHLRDEVDFNPFIADVEAEAARRGMTQVRANRVITVTTEQARLAAPLEANSNGITEGPSNGWRLIYCKGAEGEQLEFVQALGPVKRVFDGARKARRKAVGR